MKHYATLLFCLLFTIQSCTAQPKAATDAPSATDSVSADTMPDSPAIWDVLSMDTVPMFFYDTIGLRYHIADITDSATIYRTDVNKGRCFHVVSKKEYRLYVYEVLGADTLLVAHFPICYAKPTAKKTREGDGCTPESSMAKPCYIKEILPSAKWDHDFGDGRGKLYPYGPWFMRLRLSDSNNNHIGIHGSTCNEISIPGRDSEGCIRLRDNDLLVYRQLFASAGQKIIIKPYTQGKLPFEVQAQLLLGDLYKAPLLGHPLNH